jgi:hypothetical protein
MGQEPRFPSRHHDASPEANEAAEWEPYEESDGIKAQKSLFDASHDDGMASLTVGDTNGLADAIERERAFIEEQGLRIGEEKRAIGTSREHINRLLDRQRGN